MDKRVLFFARYEYEFVIYDATERKDDMDDELLKMLPFSPTSGQNGTVLIPMF